MNKLYLTLLIFYWSTHMSMAQSWNISIDVSDATCKGANDGQINLMVNGEDPVNDTLYNWQWQDALGNVIDTASDPITALGPGVYRVDVTRISDGATLSTSGRIVESDSALSITAEVLQENFCAGDAAGIMQATASGGSGTYLFGLGRGDNSSSPNYTDGYADNGGYFESLPAGTYAVWVKDSRGCQVKTPGYTITEPQPISVVYEATNPNCDDIGGQISINTISGGTPFEVNQAGNFNFELLWRDVSNDSTVARNEASVTALPEGTYEVLVTDRNECVESVRIDLERGFKFDVIEKRNISCNKEKDGLIKIALASSNPNVQEPFSIRVKDANDNEITSMARSGIASGEVSFNELGPGRYTIEVTDGLGCEKQQHVNITTPDELLVQEVVVTDIKCAGTDTGIINVIASGGSGNYQYSIDGGEEYATESLFSELSAGTYHVRLRDDAGCSYDAGEVLITEPSTRYEVEDIKVTDVLCNGKNDGEIELFFSDQTSPSHLDEDKDITWLNNRGEVIQEGAQIITGLSEGTYEVHIRDAGGCEFREEITVDKRYELRADFSVRADRMAVDYPINFEDKSLGEGIVSWLWDFDNGEGSTAPDPMNNYEQSGSYEVSLIIYNEVGCSSEKKDTIQIEDGFHFVVPTAFSPNGDQLNDTFRPEFENVLEMRMQIINMDGMVVYSSDDLSAGWNGRYNGEEAPQGIYYYEMQFTTGAGRHRKERGKVFLLR